MAEPRATDVQTGASADGSSVWPRLRVWPAIVLVALMWGVRLLPSMIDNPSRSVVMASFIGPFTCAVLILVWWLFASRARWSERLRGVGGMVLATVVSSLLLDKTMRGYGIMMFVIPWSTTAFAAALIVLGRLRTKARTYAALAAALAIFVYCDLIRNDGVWGDFKSATAWRWVRSPEETFLAELEERSLRQEQQPAADVAAKGETPVEPLAAAEWPEFRGPDRNNHVPGVKLATDWQARPPKTIWSRRVGPAWSSFVIAGNRLFTQEQRGEEEAVVCLDARTGDEIWVNLESSRFWEAVAGAGPRATPTLSGGMLFAQGAAGVLQRFDPVTGNSVWKRDLRVDANRKPPMWGFASSPLVVGDVVVVHAGGEAGKGLLAYSVATGEPVWNVACGDHSYSSPQLMTIAGREVIVILTNGGATAVDPASGKLVWEHEWKYEGYRVVQPLQVATDQLLVGTGVDQGARLLKFAANGEAFEITEVWTSKEMKPDFNDYVAHQGQLYGFDRNLFGSIDLATGKRNWKKGRYGNGQVLLLPDADQLLILSETGELVLLAANPKKLEELARFEAIEGKTWNHPTLVGNRVYVRNAEKAACVELPTEVAQPQPMASISR